MPDISTADSYIQSLLDANPLREPCLRSIIQGLDLPSTGHGLDVGCGIGLPAFLLAQAVGSKGRVTGIDLLPELCNFGEKSAASAGLAKQVTFRQGDMAHLPFENGTFDWAWSLDCVGYPAGDLRPLLEEIVRVVKPGGRIFLLGWTSQQLLPGYSLLEARLNATCSSYLPFLQDKGPEHHFLRALSSFQAVGLEALEARTFAWDVTNPLTEGERKALACLFQMLWGERQPEVSPEDWAAFRRLCLPGSPDFILALPAYYAFFTHTMFVGRVPIE